MGFLVRGKYDFVAEGRVHDFKTTTVAAYQAADRSEEHIMQGSLYRWLDRRNQNYRRPDAHSLPAQRLERKTRTDG